MIPYTWKMSQDLWDEEEGLSGRTAVSPGTNSSNEDDPASGASDGLSPIGLVSGDSSSTTLPVPVWLAESSKSFRWGWVPLPLRKAGRATVQWLKGPDPPQELLFKPLFPRVQELPVRFLDRFLPNKKHKLTLLGFLYFCWFLPWSLVLHHSVTSGHIEGYGQPSPIGCGANYWSAGNKCGLNGYDCRPFNSSAFAFRCPAFCSSRIILDPYVVGNETLNYQHLVIGGPEPGSDKEGLYRADSYVCQAAIHAGIISESRGGCGVVELTGAGHYYFPSKAHGFSSVGFPSTFPKSFQFLRLQGSQSDCPGDLRWPIFAITVVAIVLMSIFTTSPAVFFFTTFYMLILHVGLVSDPPNLANTRELMSMMTSKLLPSSFIIYVLYLYCARPLLEPLASPPIYQIEKTILYLGPAFIGALNNYTFAMWIPIQRLTPHDIKSQPGAPIALAIMITIVVTIILSQAWQIRQGGLFFHYLKIYGTIAVGLIILLILPGFRLRMHHYILGMILMPGTAFPTRPSLIYQGLLLGLFINGVARWGFASIIQTPSALGEIPGPGGKNGWWGATSPNITSSSVEISLPEAGDWRGNGNITFHLWERERMAELGVDGISVLVNDVERWRGYLDEHPKGEFTWHRHGHQGLDLSRSPTSPEKEIEEETLDGHDDREKTLYDSDDEPEDLFFRFAFMRDSNAGLYGGTGVWNRDGTWIPPPPPRT